MLLGLPDADAPRQDPQAALARWQAARRRWVWRATFVAASTTLVSAAVQAVLQRGGRPVACRPMTPSRALGSTAVAALASAAVWTPLYPPLSSPSSG